MNCRVGGWFHGGLLPSPPLPHGMKNTRAKRRGCASMVHGGVATGGCGGWGGDRQIAWMFQDRLLRGGVTAGRGAGRSGFRLQGELLADTIIHKFAPMLHLVHKWFAAACPLTDSAESAVVAYLISLANHYPSARGYTRRCYIGRGTGERPRRFTDGGWRRSRPRDCANRRCGRGGVWGLRRRNGSGRRARRILPTGWRTRLG